MNRKTALSLLALLPAVLALTRPAGASTALLPQPGHIVSADGGGIIGFNNDGSNRINYSTEGGGSTGLSVSRDGSKIVYQSARDDAYHPHIYIMNGDGTGTRQLTFGGTLANGDPISDGSPALSPDGTKIAFVSHRDTYTLPSGYIAAFNNVWVVNSDGTNLHQVTQTQPNVYGNGVYGSNVASVVWGPDSRTLAFRGLRLDTPPGQGFGFYLSVSLTHDDGSGEHVIDTWSSTGESAALDWSPDGHYLAYVFGGEAQGSPPTRLRLYDLTIGKVIKEVYEADQNGKVVVPENEGAGGLRFSPDSARLLSHDGYGVSSYTYNLDGTGVTQVNFTSGRGEALWWASGPAIPKPVRLAVTPSPAYVPVGGTVHLTPTLYDTEGNVIVHAVRAWNLSDGRFFSVSVLGDVTGGSASPYGPLTVAPDNGGVTAPPSYVVVGTPQIAFSIDPSPNLTGRNTNANTIAIGVFIKDNGDGALSNMTLQSATLNGIPAISAVGSSYGQYLAGPQPLPYGIASGFGPGQTTEIQIFFPASAALPGTRAVLKMGGNYVSGTFAGTLRITSP